MEQIIISLIKSFPICVLTPKNKIIDKNIRLNIAKTWLDKSTKK